jgi:hypothetical protein
MCGKEMRLRTILHAGSDNEVLDRLGDFGLGGDHAEIFFGRTLARAELHLEWLRERQVIEQERERQNVELERENQAGEEA